MDAGLAPDNLQVITDTQDDPVVWYIYSLTGILVNEYVFQTIKHDMCHSYAKPRQLLFVIFDIELHVQVTNAELIPRTILDK